MHRFPFVKIRPSWLVACLLLGLLALAWSAATAQAELKPINPFAIPGAASGGAPSVAATPPSAFGAPVAAPLQAPGAVGRFFAWLVDTQQSLQRELAVSVKDLKTDNAVAGALALAALSFLYGILHAVGPGHGKTIISSYVVANEQTARRGIIISFVAAFVQALSAIVLVGLLAIVFNAPGFKINQWSYQLESVSYALIALVGLWLLVTQLRGVWRRWRARQVPQTPKLSPLPLAEPAYAHAHADAAGLVHHHEFEHQHGHDHSEHGSHGGHHHGHSHLTHTHDHGHDHSEHGAHCDHMVDPQALAGPLSMRKIAAVVFSVGIRPCTGAILVLIFALTQGVFWAGVAATFAMAIGTAITVAVLATLALGSRELVLKLGGSKGAFASAVWTACAIGGALFIFTVGSILFLVSLGPTRPF